MTINSSIIVPTRNRSRLLADCLASLSSQVSLIKDFEVIVIDNGSVDSTKSVTQSFRSSMNVRYYYAPSPGLHVGRHAGANLAVSDLLLFIDDDVEITTQWLSTIIAAFQDPKIVMLGGNNLPKFLDPPPPWLLRLWDRPNLGGRAIPYLSLLHLPGNARLISPYLVWGCNFAIRKSTLLEAGGFHPDSMPQELIRFRGDGETWISQYVAESGGKCLFHPGATVYHKIPSERMSFAYFRQRGFNQGVSDSYTALRREHLAGQRPSKARIYTHLRLMVRDLSKRIKNTLQRDQDLRHVQEESYKGYRAGYAYHQHAFSNDSEVRAWVLRTNYLEDASNA